MEQIHVQGCVKLLIPRVGGVKASQGFFLTTCVHFLFRGGKEATVWEMCLSFMESFTGKGEILTDRQTRRSVGR